MDKAMYKNYDYCKNPALTTVFCPMCGAEAKISNYTDRYKEIGNADEPWLMKKVVFEGYPKDVLDEADVTKTEIYCEKCKATTEFETRRVKKGKYSKAKSSPSIFRLHLAP